MIDGQDDELDRPNAARIYDYLLGGDQNFTADRAAAEHVLDNYPDAALAARANRAFLRRAVAVLAGQGIDQFLDIGSGLPTVGNVHEVARRVNPRARVVYVDNDPVAVRYSRELLAEEGEGARGVAAIEADLRDPAAILDHPETRRLLDLRRPLGLLLVAVLHFVPDDAEARRALCAFREIIAPGSYVVISHATLDGLPADDRTVARGSRRCSRAWTWWSRASSRHPFGAPTPRATRSRMSPSGRVSSPASGAGPRPGERGARARGARPGAYSAR